MRRAMTTVAGLACILMLLFPTQAGVMMLFEDGEGRPLYLHKSNMKASNRREGGE